MADSIERLSFELTTAALTEQERAVTSLRGCAGTVLAAASVASSFLGVRASSHAVDVWSVLATISFALCFGTAISVLLPRNLVLSFGGEELLRDADEGRALAVAEGYRAACRWIEPQLAINRRTLDRLAELLTISCGLLALEVILQTISVTR